MKHENKNVLVTGGASGIRLAIAQRFLNEGAKVCVLDIDLTPLSSNASTIRFYADVSDQKSLRNAFRQLKEHWSRIDVVVNNAGISIRESFKKYPSFLKTGRSDMLPFPPYRTAIPYTCLADGLA